MSARRDGAINAVGPAQQAALELMDLQAALIGEQQDWTLKASKARQNGNAGQAGAFAYCAGRLDTLKDRVARTGRVCYPASWPQRREG